MTSPTPNRARAHVGTAAVAETDLAQKLALAVGAVFLLVGILGFVPGITTDYDLMELAGHESEAKLLGLFQVSILHNIVHLLYGVAGIVAARAGYGRTYLLAGGALYLLLAVFGFAIDQEVDINFVPLNLNDDFLHVGLGVGMIALGLLASRSAPDGRRGATI